LITPPALWENPLWYNVQPHAHSDSLCQAIITQWPIKLVSNAAIHPSNYGTCAWTIWAAHDLWTGEGYVLAPNTDIYLGLAEAYGIYTMLSFFRHYTSLYPLTADNYRTIPVYCDNKGVLECIMQHHSQQYPCETIRDDYPIFQEIYHKLQELTPFQFTFHHVKGHQDRNKNRDRPLTLSEKLLRVSIWQIQWNYSTSKRYPLAPLPTFHQMV